MPVRRGRISFRGSASSIKVIFRSKKNERPSTPSRSFHRISRTQPGANTSQPIVTMCEEQYSDDCRIAQLD
jgi:hypothetical protein